MRRLRLALLASLVLLALPAGAQAELGIFVAPDPEVPLDAPTAPNATQGYIGYPRAYRPPPPEPKYVFTGSWASIDPGRFDNAFTFGGGQRRGAQDGVRHAPSKTPNCNGCDSDWDHFSPKVVTEAAWVKATDPGNSRVIAIRAPKSCNLGGGGWGLTTGPNGGIRFTVTVKDPDTGINNVRTPEVAASQIWDGEWHAVAGVFDAGSPESRHVVSLWIDGRQASAVDLPSQDGDGEISYNVGDEFDELAIGGPTTGQSVNGTCGGVANLGFKGSIDEVQVYNFALERSQIETLQSAGPDEPPDVPDRASVHAPTISGTPKVGEDLTCNDTDNLVNRTFTWERAPRATHFENDANWFPINGAAGATYTVQQADAGSRVRCHEYGDFVTDGGNVPADRPSDSLRADVDIPHNVLPPTISGAEDPVPGTTLTCNHGTWTNGPDESDFGYQWLRNGLAIQGDEATHKTYTLTRTWNGVQLIDPHGDGGKPISCLVRVHNDVGGTEAISNEIRAIDGKPFRSSRPHPVLGDPPPGDANPLHRRITCVGGSLRDDYAALGIEPYQHTWTWYRNGKLVATTDTPRYDPQTEDLGRKIGCGLRSENPDGFGVSTSLGAVRVELPKGERDGYFYREGGHNGADPSSLLALDQDYVDAVGRVVEKHLRAGVAIARQECRDGKNLNGQTVPDGPPDPADVPNHKPFHPLPALLRCQILLHAPQDRISVLYIGGVRYRNDRCTVIPDIAKERNFPLCPSLRIQLPPINPTHPPATGDDLNDIKAAEPKQIIWDLDGNGTADAICPGSAPVLRTILDPGQWHPRAVIVNNDSAQTGVFHFADETFNTSVHDNAPAGELRVNQVRVCATAFDPPPNPAASPCMTNGTVGRMQLTGDICPVDVRALDPEDYEDLLGGPQFRQLRDFLLAMSEDRLKNEPGTIVTSRLKRHPEGETTWVPWHSAGNLHKASAGTAATATYEDTTAALTSWQSPGGYGTPVAPHVDDVKGLVDKNKNFAMDQVYVTKKPLGVNGVTQDPLGNTSMLMVPSDVKDALPDTHNMILAGRDAASHLGLPSVPDGLPLTTGGVLNSALSDVPHSPDDVMRETNLDDVKRQLQDKANGLKGEALQRIQNLINQFDLGPFKLTGDAKIHAESDGTASIEADAKFPLLKTSPKDKDGLSIHLRMHVDLQGHIALRGLHLHKEDAYLGSLHLSGLDLDYDSDGGFTVKGQILFPPVNDGVAINKFQIGPQGQFRALDVDYLAGAGQGISVGPGLFLTTIGGGLDLPLNLINAHAVLSVGPSPGGGCPTAGMDGRLRIRWDNPDFNHEFTLDSVADVKLACIKIADTTLHADTGGLVTLAANMHFPPPDVDLGPVYFDAHIGGAIKIPDGAWQIDAFGDGGIHDLLTGRIEAALSNAGFAACGRADVEIPLLGKFVSLFTKHPKKVVIHLAGGASVDFVDDLPPIDITTFLANLHLFVGCDIGGYRTVTHKAVQRTATGPGLAFDVPKNAGASLFSIEGAGHAPHVRLRSPSGQVYDFSDAVQHGKKIGRSAWGKVLESEDRTVALFGDPEGGTWRAVPVGGSAKVIRVRQAPLLPKPQVKAKVTGHGSRRTLSYQVAPISKQVVRFVELVRGGEKLIKTVKTGGKGSVKFTLAEGAGVKRTIVAEVFQNSIPRGNFKVAQYVAKGPTVGKPRHVRVRRHGRSAVVTWKQATLGSRYEVTVRYGDGRTSLLIPHGRKLSVTVPQVHRGEGLRVTVGAISATNRRGPLARAKLKGNMHVGRVRHLPPANHNKKKHHHHG